MDKRNFAVIIESFAILTGKQIGEKGLDIYYGLLKDYTNEEVEEAAAQLLKTHKFNIMPMPAAFIEIIEGSSESLANNAWDMALRVVRGGSCSDLLVYKLVSNLNLKDLHTENIPFARRDFIRLYKELYSTYKKDEALKLNKKNVDMSGPVKGLVKGVKL